MTPLPPTAPEQNDRLRRALTGLVIEVFRLNGDLLAAGEALVGDLGLTSARWQVLGAIALSPVPVPVAHIARNMGLTRQAVQRSVDEMREAGVVQLEPNPHHRRAMLVTMSERGEAAYRAASERQGRWAEALAADLSPEGLETAAHLLREVQRRLANPGTIAATDTTKLEENRDAEVRGDGSRRHAGRTTQDRGGAGGPDQHVRRPA